MSSGRLLPLILLSFSFLAACANVSVQRAPATAIASVDEETIAREIDGRMMRVEEFAAIREWGRTNGIRVWGAGGTAAGLAIYVKQQLENEALAANGAPLKYSAGRFTYNYFDIFRSTQDADIVIDATESKAAELESFLHKKFPYLQGSKAIWEVRLLNGKRGEGAGEKDPLLGYDFQNQNSDSFSTGMIEITDPPRGESRVRDLFDWTNTRDPRFLHDIAEGKVTFYRNAEHSLTKRAREGLNPEILGVIRALTKAFQYESEWSDEDEREFHQIIQKFNPNESMDSAAENQIAKNAKKLFWHSPDVEHAWNELERLGLRKKLIKFGEKHWKDEVVEWLNKEPLRTAPLGQKGKTAGELGISVVAHETNSFQAYENISRSQAGKANVFISRVNVDGENAGHGPGFYTRKGTSGARGTGLTIRFELDPMARLGADFVVVDDYVIVRNGAALKVIDESLNLTPLEYFRLLGNGEFDEDDLGMLEKLKMKMKLSSLEISKEEGKSIVKIVNQAIRKADPEEGMRSRRRRSGRGLPDEFESGNLPPVISEWLKMSEAKKYPKLLQNCVERFPSERLLAYPIFAESDEFATAYDRWMRTSIKDNAAFAIRSFLANPALFGHPKYGGWVKVAVDFDENGQISNLLSENPELAKHPDFEKWMDFALSGKRGEKIVGEGQIAKSLKRMRSRIRRNADPDVARRRNLRELMAEPWLISDRRYSGWANRLVSEGRIKTLTDALERPEAMALPDYPKWIEMILEQDPERLESLFTELDSPLRRRPEFVRWFLIFLKGSEKPAPFHMNELNQVIKALVREGHGATFQKICGKSMKPNFDCLWKNLHDKKRRDCIRLLEALD